VGDALRQLLTFECEGARLFGTLDGMDGEVGLLIVSGGNEIRIGAHRGMAKLAAAVADHGHPVFRFDRRGIGDSEGTNLGYLQSGPDIRAALSAFRKACPQMHHVMAFGNCDAATALILQPELKFSAFLANPWIIERSDALPPVAAIRVRYLERLRNPSAWVDLLRGKINLAKLAKGLVRILHPQPRSELAALFAERLARYQQPVTLLLASKDATAIAFDDAWQGSLFAKLRNRTNIKTCRLRAASHSFAGNAEFAVLKAEILSALAQ
jgi:exosortase A-associated hydrolase 1